MMSIRLFAAAALAVALVAVSAPAAKAAVITPSSYSVLLLCELTGGGGFLCDAYPNGGVGPYRFTWTPVQNAGIRLNYGDEVWGRCTVGTYAAMRVTVVDRYGHTGAATRSFYCSSIAP